LKPIDFEKAMKMVPTHIGFQMHDIDQISSVMHIESVQLPAEVIHATTKTIQFLSTTDRPGSIGSPDLKFAAWLLERSGWKNGTAN
jgi:hypothetical protein